MREVRRDAADGAAFAFDVEQREAAFGGGIELDNPRNLEPALWNCSQTSGARPLPQAIRSVRGLGRRRRGVE
jgi:hypothetical protein